MSTLTKGNWDGNGCSPPYLARVATKRSQDEFEKELQANVHLLKKACHEFDAGDLEEFRNIARAVRLIATKDPQNGDLSLMELAGRSHDPMLDTGTYSHRLSIAPEFSLVTIVLGPKTVGCRAPLDDAANKRQVSLTDWLSGQPVINDREGGVFNRLRLIKAVANSGGSTHYPADVRAYFARLQEIGVGARLRGQNIEVKYRDFEKHTLRQIAHELIVCLDPGYTRMPQLEGRAIVFTAQEVILYPGRTMYASSYIKQVAAPAIFLHARTNDVESISGFMVKLPYEEAPAKAPCPCQSGLRFDECCAMARQFDPSFVEAFERRYSLGEFRDGVAKRSPTP